MEQFRLAELNLSVLVKINAKGIWLLPSQLINVRSISCGSNLESISTKRQLRFSLFNIYLVTMSEKTSRLLWDTLANPVSYTHLDVYKRQIIELQAFNVGNEDGRSVKVIYRNIKKSLNPVSYTHLTLYASCSSC